MAFSTPEADDWKKIKGVGKLSEDVSCATKSSLKAPFLFLPDLEKMQKIS